MAKGREDYVIATRLTLSGEKEFNTAMKQAAETTKALNADMELAKAKFAASGNETDFLADKLRILGEQLENKKGQLQMMNEQLEGMRSKSAQAEEKVRQLEQQLALTPQGTAEWQQLKDQLDNAKLAATRTAKELKTLESAAKNTETAAYKLQAEINDTTEAQEKLGRESEEAGQKIEDNLGDAADEVESKFKRMSKSITQDLGEIKKMQKLSIAIDLVSKGKNAASQIYNFASNAAAEGMKDAMAEYNIASSGGDTAQAQAQMREYTAIFGDKDSAREAVANLAALNLGQDEYSKAAKAIGGAAIKFQDTLKVESLADSLQESIATGALTGNIAEFFGRMESETDVTTEEINAGLAEAKRAEAAGDEGAVENAMLAYLSQSGIGDYYENFKEQNADLIAAADATKSIEQTLQEIATDVATVMAPMLKDVATDILPPISDAIKAIKDKLWELGLDNPDTTLGEKADLLAKTGINTVADAIGGILDIPFKLWDLAFGVGSAGAEELPEDATPNRESWPTASNAFTAANEIFKDKETRDSVTSEFKKGQSAYEEGKEYTSLLVDKELEAMKNWFEQDREKYAAELEYASYELERRKERTPEQEAAAKEADQAMLQLLFLLGQTDSDLYKNRGGPEIKQDQKPLIDPLAYTLVSPTDPGGAYQQLEDLAAQGTETGQTMMTNMAAGAQESMANLEAVQQQAREMVEAVWKPDINATVVMGYRMGAMDGPVNQNLTVQLQPQPVQLDGRTLTKVLTDPVNVMLSKMITKN